MHTFNKTVAGIICVLLIGGCSVKQFAISRIGDALADGGSVYASDDDYLLVGDALPFSLKTVEGLLQEVPEHKGLLITAAKGFTQYGYAYVELESFRVEPEDFEHAQVLALRAKKLYLRGFAYALRAVELQQTNFIDKLRSNHESALSVFDKNHVPELYWLSLSWAAAISADKSDMEIVADLNLIEPIIFRCLTLDESFNDGALHDFMIAYQGGRSSLQGGSVEKAREHFSRAMELARNTRVAPLVSLAESVSVPLQNKDEFQRLLNQALQFDVDVSPQTRLANIVAQQKARLLLSRIDHLFLED